MESTVNERVKLLRSSLKLTQQEFATRIGLSKVGVWKLEQGETKPRMSTLVGIANEFGIEKDWLIDGIGELEIVSPTESKSSWKDKAFEVMERQNEHLAKEVQFLRGLLTNITGQAQANFNEAFNLVALSDKKGVESVRVAA